MSYHPAILEGLAQLLHANDLGVYRENGIFTAAERGIVIQTFPETPPEIIGVSLYLPEGLSLSPTATHRLSTTRVQIKYRLQGHPFAGIELFDQLHALIDQKPLALGNVEVAGEYKSFSALGQSRTGFEFSTNWELTGLAALTLP